MRELDKALAAGLVKTDNHTRGYMVEDEEERINTYVEWFPEPKALAAVLFKQIRKLEKDVAELKARNVKKADTIEADINHLIDFIKWLGQGQKPTYTYYKNYIAKTGAPPRIAVTNKPKNSKFSQLIKQTIEVIFIRELPKHFTREMAIQMAKFWAIDKKRVESILNNSTICEMLPQLFSVIRDGENIYLVGANAKKIQIPSTGKVPIWSKKKWVLYEGEQPQKVELYFKY
jgi:hypothetical protein